MHSAGRLALTASLLLLGVSAGPLERRQETTTTSSATIPSVGMVVVTSGSTVLTLEVENPALATESANSTEPATTTSDATATDASSTISEPFPSRTGKAPDRIPSKDFPTCHAEDMQTPFCLPIDEQEVYVGISYYITWNPTFFSENTTSKIMLNYANETEKISRKQAWESEELDSGWGFVAVEMKEEWLQGYSRFNLSVVMAYYETDAENARTEDGPLLQLRKAPVRHLPPPPHNKLNKEGLTIGLPVGLGVVFLIMGGLFFGMRSQRRIGLGNVMGRKSGYGARQSRRQRLGLGKKAGAIQLEDRELQPRSPEVKYHDNIDEIRPAPIREPGHGRDASLGSLVSNGSGPNNGGNVFRSEIERQRTGR